MAPSGSRIDSSMEQRVLAELGRPARARPSSISAYQEDKTIVGETGVTSVKWQYGRTSSRCNPRVIFRMLRLQQDEPRQPNTEPTRRDTRTRRNGDIGYQQLS